MTIRNVINTLFIDIETGKADDYELFMPDKIKNPKPFERKNYADKPFTNKVKRLVKDTDATYAIKVNAAETEFIEKQDLAIAEFNIKQELAEAEHNENIINQRKEWESKCALSPITGKVLCAGFLWIEGNGEDELICFGNNVEGSAHNEPFVLKQCVSLLSDADIIVGHNIKDFDLFFIANRCRKHGITFPEKLYSKYHGKFNWKEHITDTMDLWGMGKWKEMISLDNLCKFFGIEGKDTDASKNFEELWCNDREKAIEHCKNDILITKQIYKRLT